MPLTVFVAVLGAALLHAGWNALIRIGTAKLTSMLILTLVQGGIGLAIALTRDAPAGSVWAWLLTSGFFHAGYKLFLAFAYEQGDLSRVYPIARGAAPLFVLAFSVAFLAEPLAAGQVTAILLLGLGILLMGQEAIRSGESRRLVPLALASASMTAGYSLVDGLGARLSGDPVAFVGWLFVLDAALFTPSALALRGWAVVRAPVGTWVLGVAGAAFSYAAYAIVVWAMTQAPIPLVSALRETSILFAVGIGRLAFQERIDARKVFATFVILAGVALARL